MGTLLTALFPATREALLVSMFRQPDRRFYLTELIEIVGRGRGTVQRELASLSGAGVVGREVSAGRVYYQANRRCPIFPELQRLVEKTAGWPTLLAEQLACVEGVRLAFVFGSMARGEAGAESDIDLAVIGGAAFRDVVRAVAPSREILSRDVNPVVYSPAEFQRRIERRDRFVCELLTTTKQFIVGTHDDLEAVAGQQVAR